MIAATDTVIRSTSSDLSFFSKSKKANSQPLSPSKAVVVTTRLVPVQKPAQKFVPLSPFANMRKRKASDSPSSDANAKKSRTSPPPAPLRLADSMKRSRSRTPVPLLPSRHSTRTKRTTSPESSYRNSRSRSVTAFCNDTTFPRECWIDEDGVPGPRVQSCEVVVKSLMKSYKAYFKNPNDPNDKFFDPHPTSYPVADLEYPNNSASERFILLAPKDKDHYNPIFCLQNTLHVIIEGYLTQQQQSLFGTVPNTNLLESDEESPTSSSPPRSEQLPVSLPIITAIDSNPPSANYLKALQRAIHRHDGPLFVTTLAAINKLLRLLKYPPLPHDLFVPTPTNMIKEAVRSWTPMGMPKEVTTRIIEETYQRCVGPRVRTLKRYEAFSSEVYGELMPSLSSEIIRAVGLKKDSLFMDLGSGVGNVVLQASLETGCTSYGIEVMPAPAEIARSQLEQLKIRCKMWGVSMGQVELEEGDMLKSNRVHELMCKADVVLINNKVFLESLNESLRPKFLDLKEGAIVVSLKPFVPVNARLTERNIDDISAIFEVTQKEYRSGSVSWGSGGGSYYLHRVDREGYVKIRQKLERSGRATRIRR